MCVCVIPCVCVYLCVPLCVEREGEKSSDGSVTSEKESAMEISVDLRHRKGAQRPMHLLPCEIHAVRVHLCERAGKEERGEWKREGSFCEERRSSSAAFFPPFFQEPLTVCARTGKY